MVVVVVVVVACFIEKCEQTRVATQANCSVLIVRGRNSHPKRNEIYIAEKVDNVPQKRKPTSWSFSSAENVETEKLRCLLPSR